VQTVNLPEMTLPALTADLHLHEHEDTVVIADGVTARYVGDINGRDTEHVVVYADGFKIAEIGDHFLWIDTHGAATPIMRSRINRILGDNGTNHAVHIAEREAVLLEGATDVRRNYARKAGQFVSAMLHRYDDGHWEMSEYNGQMYLRLRAGLVAA